MWDRPETIDLNPAVTGLAARHAQWMHVHHCCPAGRTRHSSLHSSLPDTGGRRSSPRTDARVFVLVARFLICQQRNKVFR